MTITREDYDRASKELTTQSQNTEEDFLNAKGVLMSAAKSAFQLYWLLKNEHYVPTAHDLRLIAQTLDHITNPFNEEREAA